MPIPSVGAKKKQTIKNLFLVILCDCHFCDFLHWILSKKWILYCCCLIGSIRWEDKHRKLFGNLPHMKSTEKFENLLWYFTFTSYKIVLANEKFNPSKSPKLTIHKRKWKSTEITVVKHTKDLDYDKKISVNELFFRLILSFERTSHFYVNHYLSLRFLA